MSRSPASPLNVLAVLLISVWMMLPVFSSLVGFGPLLLLVLVWALSSDIETLSRAVGDNAWLLVWLGFLVILLATNSWDYGGVSFVFFLESTVFFSLGAIFFRYYERRHNYGVLALACAVSLSAFSLGAVLSSIQLWSHPLASRILATAAPDKSYIALGVGGFGHVYAAVVVVASLGWFGLRIRRRRPLIAVAALAMIAAVSVFVVMSQYTMALLFTTLMLGLLLVRTRSGRTLFIVGAVALVLLILYGRQFGELLVALASLLPDTYASQTRVLDLSQLFLNGQASDLSEDRLTLYGRSLTAFFNSPVFGLVTRPSALSVGGHSGWLDLLGAFGLAGAAPFGLFLRRSFRQQAEAVKNIEGARVVLMLAWAYAFLFGIVNPIAYVKELGYVLLFVLPSVPFLYLRLHGEPGSSHVEEHLRGGSLETPLSQLRQRTRLPHRGRGH
jgi:hypothetical protein